MNKKKEKKKIIITRFAVRTLAISASTLSLIDFLKGEYQAGGFLALGWLAIIIGETRMFKVEESDDES
tara:strand:- start:50 stop:253 length:204 start_codon:yes stop_codon:yes gene_type:complete